MDHNQERFAKDQDAVAMYSLITNFFLDELKLDFVSKEEIEHMIGVLLTNGFENDHEEVTVLLAVTFLSVGTFFWEEIVL